MLEVEDICGVKEVCLQKLLASCIASCVQAFYSSSVVGLCVCVCVFPERYLAIKRCQSSSFLARCRAVSEATGEQHFPHLSPSYLLSS